MKILFYFLIASLLFVACNTNTDPNAIERDAEFIVEPEMSLDGKHCFLTTLAHDPFITDRGDTIQFIDSTVIQLEIKGEQVTGIYNWMPAEKDQAHGTVTGVIGGNTISGLYDYTIEGFNQKEEIILEIRDNGIAIKSGELEENADGVLVLKDVSKTEFGEIIPRVDCK